MTIGKTLTVALVCAALNIDATFADSRDTAPTGAERIRKLELALKTLGVPNQARPDFSEFPVAGSVSTDEFQSIAKYIDPDGGLRRYLEISPSNVVLFPTPFAPSGTNPNPDYELATGASANRDSSDLIARLDKVARNPASAPLAGLRVAIDPGHMGTPFWNDKDGKFVTIHGKTVAEGEINLWTAELLAIELEKLGAEVKLTRTDLNPVTHSTWDNFDPRDRLAEYYYKGIDDWMAKYFAMSDSDLVRLIPKDPNVRKIQGYDGKINLFLQEDMNARSELVAAYNPDLFIDIHYDSQLTDGLQSRGDDTSVYVPGGIRKNETGPVLARALMLQQMVEVRRWKQSVKMASAMVNAMSKSLGIRMISDAQEVPTSVKVVDGVLARNIYETKHSTHGLTAFFEAFHYDYVREFPALTTLDHSAVYHGTTFRYPARLEAVANGMRDGLVQYFREFQTN
jgi:N-acetylmuramoyl-L-alanine amidase